MAKVGTHDIDSLLQNHGGIPDDPEFGIDESAQAVQQDLEAHDRNLRDMLAGIASSTNERLWASANTDTMEMFEADEGSRVPTQRLKGGYNYGAPLRKRQISVGWDREFFRRKTVASSPPSSGR